MSAPETSAPVGRRDPDAGDTLIEILISVAILGIVGVALIGGFLTAISSSSVYRKVATADTVLRTAVDSVTTQMQQNPSAAFGCPEDSAVYTVSGLPSGYSSQVTSVSYWVNGAAQATCVAESPQLITLAVTYTGANGKSATNRATFAVNDPQAAPVPNFSNATKLVFLSTGGPSNSTAGSAIPEQPIVAVEDASGHIVTSDLSSVVLAITSGSGTTGATLKYCSGSEFYGVVNFSGCEIDVAGSGYTLSATDGTLASATSSSFTVSPGPAASLVFTQWPAQATPAGTDASAFTYQPTVTVEDAYGNIATEDSSAVTLSITSGTGTSGATLSCTSNPLNASAGVAAFTGCSINTPGSGYTLTATDGSLTSATSTAFTIAAGSPDHLAFTTEPVASAGGQAGTGGTAFTQQPVVTIEDAAGYAVTSNTSTVTLSITSNTGPAGAALTCSPSNDEQAASAGVATFSGCAVNTAGSGYTLTATDGTIKAATSTSFSIGVGPAAQLAFTTEPGGTITGGVAFPTQPAVTVEDAGGNTVTSNTSTVTLSITSGTGTSGASLTCSPSNDQKAASAGIATFSGCAINKAGSGYTLKATDGSLANATSTSFTVAVGPAAQLSFSTQPSGTNTAGTAFSTQPAVTVEDAGGNAVVSSSVTLSITSGATLTCTANTVTTNSSGVATFSGCKTTTAGSGYTLTATDGSLNATSNTFNVAAGTATKLAFTTEPPGSVVKGSSHTFSTSVSVEDAYGNTVTGNSSSVTLKITSSGNTLSCTTNPLAASSGVAAFSGCYFPSSITNGNYTLTATDGSLTSAASSTIDVT